MGFAVVTLLAVLFSTLSFIADAIGPRGMYDFTDHVATSYSYLEFRNGHVVLVTPDSRRPMGSYCRKNGRWVWVAPTGVEVLLTPSPLRLRLFEQDGNEDSMSPLQRLFRKPHLKSY
jgi:hypothetical protein